MDIIETLLRWIVHAAIFRAMWAMPLPVVLGVGVAGLLSWWGWRRVRGGR